MSQVQTQAGGPRGRAPDPLLGASLGGFRLVEVLGKGGMATVYLGRRQGQNVAVKVLDPRRCKNPDEVKQFLREAQTISLLPPGVGVHHFQLGRNPWIGCFSPSAPRNEAPGSSVSDDLGST